MSTTTAPAPASPALDDDEPDHVTCCVDDDLALCGSDVSDAVPVETFTNPCVVCVAMVDGPFCPKLGPTGCVDGP